MTKYGPIRRTTTVVVLAAAAALPAAAPAAADAPTAGCPSGGGFVQEEQNLPPGTKGAPSASINESTTACFNELENAPQRLKDLIGVDTVEVVIDDVVGGSAPH
jgi:hypothetical protein